MGDHRASIKVEFSMYGETEKWDAWINWSDYNSECDGVDQRVIDWFRDAHQEFYYKHMEESRKREAEADKARKDATEKQEYARLKAKFEGNPKNEK